MVSLKSERELGLMRVANKTVALILRELADMVAPGVTTGEIDRYAERRCRECGVIPAFKGYHGYPASVCISINEEVIHGIPSNKRVIKEGDIVSLDFGVCQDGWYGDSAITVPVGNVTPEAQRLIDVTRESLNRAISVCRVGNRLFDIGFAVQNYVEGLGYGVVREFVGHGIGRALHEEPQVPNFGAKGKGLQLKAGMVLAIEPMVNIGSHKVKVLDDGWTTITEDKTLSAHFEHTIAVTEAGPEILTLL